MSHPEQTNFVELIKDLNISKVKAARILEVGSSATTFGSIRSIFPPCKEYVGIDLSPGPGVDIVMNAHELNRLQGKFDVVVSCEALEHDPDWKTTIKNILNIMTPQGFLVLSCATTGRPEHGTKRTNPADSPGSQSIGWDHYKNVASAELVDFVKSLDPGFETHVWTNRKIFDLYALVFRSSAAAQEVQIPTSEQMSKLMKSTRFFFQIACWPIRVVVRIFGVSIGEIFGRIYWTTLSKLKKKNRIKN